MEKIQTFNTLKGSVKTFDDLLGRILYKVTAENKELRLYLTETPSFKFYHEQDCCESVSIEEIIGDLDDLVGVPMLEAREDPQDGEWRWL